MRERGFRGGTIATTALIGVSVRLAYRIRGHPAVGYLARATPAGRQEMSQLLARVLPATSLWRTTTMRLTLWKILAALWTALGIGLLSDAVSNTIRWQSDPIYTSVGLNWDWTGGVAGSLALFLGVWLLANGVARWFGYLVTGMFAVYTLTYLVMGDQGTLLYRIALPVLVLVLSVVTGWQIHRERTNHSKS
jgi:hypothetical protein